MDLGASPSRELAPTTTVHRRVAALARTFRRLAIRSLVVAAGIVPMAAAWTPAARARPAPVTPAVAIQDGWIEQCDSHADSVLPAIAPRPDFHVGPTAVQSPYWRQLHTHLLRITIPWDIAYHHDRTDWSKGGIPQANAILQTEQTCFNYWLADLHAHGDHAIVQFKPDYNDLGLKRLHGHWKPVLEVPSLAEYRRAMRNFTRTYSCVGKHHHELRTCPIPAGQYPAGTPFRMARVSIIEPWGEPDVSYDGSTLPQRHFANAGLFYMPHGTRLFGQQGCSSGIDRCGPVLAANMWKVVRHDCLHCRVVAGTFSSLGGISFAHSLRDTYLAEYNRALFPFHPSEWDLDPYSSISTFERSCFNPPGAAVDPLQWEFSHNYRRDLFNPFAQPRRAFNRCIDSTSLPVAFKRRMPVHNIFDLSIPLVSRFSEALKLLGYTHKTSIGFGEISVFDSDFLVTRTLPGGQIAGAWYGWEVQTQAAEYLLNRLAKPGALTPAGAPEVRIFALMRFADGTGFPKWALVLRDKNGVAHPVPAFWVFAHRRHPH